LATAAELGWGIEGPAHAEGVLRVIESIARGDAGNDAGLADTIANRDLGTRPVDALFQSAGLLIEAHHATGTHRDELLSAARGWLQVAVRRSPQ
jgi:hypothetical protein